jgi:hypothetical protein
MNRNLLSYGAIKGDYMYPSIMTYEEALKFSSIIQKALNEPCKYKGVSDRNLWCIVDSIFNYNTKRVFILYDAEKVLIITKEDILERDSKL